MKLQIWVLGITFIANLSYGGVCPTPPTSINPLIESSHTFDSASQYYTYIYKVSNSGANAKLAIYTLSIESGEGIQEVRIPESWESKFKPSKTNTPSRYRFLSHVNAIKANSAPYEFIIKSKNKPGITKFYAEGSLVEQLKAITINNDNESVPDCPGFFEDAVSTLEQMVTGSTIGPVNSNQVEAHLKMVLKKNKSDKKVEIIESENPEISPTDEGEVELSLKNIDGLNLSSIDINSIAFGPSKSKPLSTALLTNGPKNKSDKEKKEKALLMKFKLSDLKIRCDLDKALFFKANANDKVIRGAVKIKSSICDTKLWSQMSALKKR